MAIKHNLTRRDLLIGSGVVGAGVVIGGAFTGNALIQSADAARNSPTPGPSPSPTPKPLTYHSTALTIPETTSWTNGTTAGGLLFVDPQVKDPKGFHGLIMTDDGEPVWIEPVGANITDLRVQSYQGKPVLTYWVGISAGGHGKGAGVILDSSYRPIHQVSGGNGEHGDLHEFHLTSRGTALITSYHTVNHDLSSIGGPVDGYIFNCLAQEVDIATGKVLLDWSARDHVDVTESYLGIKQDEGHDGTTPARAYDAFHMNAIDADGDALLISLRHTSTIYRVERTKGTVLWRFGGTQTDFPIPAGAAFHWQHDVRRNPDKTISLFDNHLYSGKDGHSRGMVFTLDESAHTAAVKHIYSYKKHLGTAMGSMQLLDNGNVLVGWGTDPAVTEFTADGTAIYEATLGGMAYRANRSPWVGRPATAPDVAVQSGKKGTTTVYASWNGATEVAQWRVLTGQSADSLSPGVTAKRSGFETTISVPAAPMVAVQALNASGGVLGTSAIAAAA